MKYINADNVPYVFNCDAEENIYSGKDVKRAIDSMTAEDVISREEVMQMFQEILFACNEMADKGSNPLIRLGFCRGKNVVLAEVEKQITKLDEGKAQFLEEH